MGTAFVVLRVLELSCLYWREKSCWLSCWLGRGMDFGARFELSAMPYSSLTRYRKEQRRLMVWFVGLFGLLQPVCLSSHVIFNIAVFGVSSDHGLTKSCKHTLSYKHRSEHSEM